MQLNSGGLILKVLSVLILTFTFFLGHSQVLVKGPACIRADLEYQYEIKGVPATTTGFKICVTNGKLVTAGGACYNGEPISTFRVVWNPGITSGRIVLTSSNGNAIIDVTAAKSLNGGIIEKGQKDQFIKQNQLPAVISCSAATGGGCAPKHIYQWQQSTDGLYWENITGATGLSLRLTTPLKSTLYFRRMVRDEVSNNINYSDIATVAVSLNE